MRKQWVPDASPFFARTGDEAMIWDERFDGSTYSGINVCKLKISCVVCVVCVVCVCDVCV